MAHLHLTVVQAHATHQCAALGNPRRNEFVWNDDFTAFRVVALKWWDDQSYIDYELDGVDPQYQADAEYEAEYQALHPELAPAVDPAPAPTFSQSEDDIPF